MMKICSFIASAVAAAGVHGAPVEITPSQTGWSVQTPAYAARIGPRGYLASLRHGETEFLAPNGNTPGGFYLCMESMPPLTDLTLQDAVLSGRNNLGTVSWRFEPDTIRVTVVCSNEKGVAFYAVMEPRLDLVLLGRGDLRRPPQAASTARTVWYGQDDALEIDGGDRIWGPWKEHQVWEARLSDGETRTITLRPRRKTEWDEAMAAPPPKPVFDVTAQYTTPPQIPLCMIGDSITWWNDGDTWRQFLLEHIPSLAFVGTHSARLGYSHAGEGGNSIEKVIARVGDIPDCPNYALLIGTNNNNVKTEHDVEPRSRQAAEKIEELVGLLLGKPSVQTVFLGSILPCKTDNPLRDRTNAATNVLLRKRLAAGAFPEQVVWVEYENPIRQIADWEPKIKLHPTPEGYRVLAEILADAIRRRLNVPPDLAAPVPKATCGVRIHNLWDPALGETSSPVIAGYYTLSFDVASVADGQGKVQVGSAETAPEKGRLKVEFPVLPAQQGTRVEHTFYTREEGYRYTRASLKITATNCDVRNILLEKMRPGGQASTYGIGIYVDTETTPQPGELIEPTAVQ